MARTIKRGAKQFADLYSSLVLPTSTLRLCTDTDLVERREQAAADLATAKYASNKRPAEASMAEEEQPSDVAAAQAALDAIDDEIDASDQTVILEVSAPSESQMGKIQHLYDDDKLSQWQNHVVALCLDQPVEQVEAMREHITRGAWTHLTSQVFDLVGGGVVTLPTRRPSSASTPNSPDSSEPPAPGD